MYINVAIVIIVAMVIKSVRKKRADISTIQIFKETKKKLDELGKKNDTYDQIIRKLLEK